jgi:hypothetical protein
MIVKNQLRIMNDIEKIIADKKVRVKFLLDDADFLDEDGYPTEQALEVVEKWHWDDIPGWFQFIKSIWHLHSWGWKEKLEPHDWNGKFEQYKNRMVQRHYVSTGGWSGNESIIGAMQRNDMMWHLNWVQSRRGGHYIFEEYHLAD